MWTEPDIARLLLREAGENACSLFECQYPDRTSCEVTNLLLTDGEKLLHRLISLHLAQKMKVHRIVATCIERLGLTISDHVEGAIWIGDSVCS